MGGELVFVGAATATGAPEFRGQSFTTDPAKARAHIDRFVNNESIHGTDVVLWYAGHFAHDIHHGQEVAHIVGPTLTLADW